MIKFGEIAELVKQGSPTGNAKLKRRTTALTQQIRAHQSMMIWTMMIGVIVMMSNRSRMNASKKSNH